MTTYCTPYLWLPTFLMACEDVNMGAADTKALTHKWLKSKGDIDVLEHDFVNIFGGTEEFEQVKEELKDVMARYAA